MLVSDQVQIEYTQLRRAGISIRDDGSASIRAGMASLDEQAAEFLGPGGNLLKRRQIASK